jgi:mono/diheme cytochrome c family protein
MFKRIFFVLVVLGVAGAVAAAGVVYAGLFDVAATQPHTELGFKAFHFAMQRSVRVRAADITVPDLSNAGRLTRGHGLFRTHCEQCHGGPGVAPKPFAQGLRPLASNLVQDGRDWPSNELYWVVKHGVRMSAMPGWEYRFTPDELWDVVAFVKQLHLITPAQYQAVTPPALPLASPGLAQRVPDSRTGKFLINQYMCATCHTIPGIAGADRTVGPPLTGVGERIFIAGNLRNTPKNMVRWLQHPQQIRPGSAMPDLGVGEDEARQIAAYLATLREQP